jgi:hypothetical protein
MSCYRTFTNIMIHQLQKIRFGRKLIIDRSVPCSSDMNIRVARIEDDAYR